MEINALIQQKLLEKQRLELEVGRLERTTVDLFSPTQNVLNNNAEKRSSTSNKRKIVELAKLKKMKQDINKMML